VSDDEYSRNRCCLHPDRIQARLLFTAVLSFPTLNYWRLGPSCAIWEHFNPIIRYGRHIHPGKPFPITQM
jgi:hypothetical protein